VAPERAPDIDAGLDLVAGWVRDAGHVMVLTGAGMSTESGIPDFRGPNGLWTKNPAAEKLATLDHYLSSREARVRSWRNRLESAMWEAEPNAGHRALAELERNGHLHTLVTQNVDGLHQKAGSSPHRVIEIHGTVHAAKCMTCGWRGPMEPVLDRVRAGEDDPDCLHCGGILKSATISFGEQLVADDLDRAHRAAMACDLFLALGTSLGVYPAAALPEVAVRAGARLVIVNGEETPFDPVADAVLHAPLGEVLPRLAALVRAGSAGPGGATQGPVGNFRPKE
jgi:NAD-dependent deacetylase